jgi:hypothetical protein
VDAPARSVRYGHTTAATATKTVTRQVPSNFRDAPSRRVVFSLVNFVLMRLSFSAVADSRPLVFEIVGFILIAVWLVGVVGFVLGLISTIVRLVHQ